MKQCTKCKKWKDESEFYKEAKGRDGLTSCCKKCRREYYRQYGRKIRKTAKEYYRYEERHRVVNGVKQKRCSRCKKWMAESKFYKKLRHKDGLAVRCKECANKATYKSRKRRRLAERN